MRNAAHFALHSPLRSTCASLLAVLLLAGAAAAEERSGEQIYKDLCAACHGAKGEGVDEHYPHPLVGDRSLKELTQYIEESMPEDDPTKCVGEDAAKVAAYVFETYYSPLAQARNKPARIELSRLTVRQYQNSVADLVGTFRSAGKWGQERGLKGEYYKSRRPGRDRQIERIDPTVQFDFGEASPDPEKLDDPASFSIRWEGSVLAPETGEYEFIVRTEHAARLWINDWRRADRRRVKSGSDVEHRATIRLLGGRVSLKLEFSKAKQGSTIPKSKSSRPRR
jgi:cytochrome c553